MCSGGMRVGALPLLKVGDLIEVWKCNIYQIRIYANSKSNRHYTFCTPECRKAIDNYIDYRKQCGKNITPKSPLLRRESDRNDIFQVANDIKPLTTYAIKDSLTKILYASGIRTPLVVNPKPKGNVLNARRETMLSHGFRKFFDTTCTHSGMNPIYIEFCLGHSLKGVKDSYFLPQPDSNGIYLDILEGHDKSPGYLDAIDWLTINDENRLLRAQVEEYKAIAKPAIDQIEEFQREINDLKLHINEEIEMQKKKNNNNSSSKKKKKRSSSSSSSSSKDIQETYGQLSS
jgi:hypothetical protein